MNKYVATGNLVADPKVSARNTTVLSFRVAVNNRRKVNDEWQDDPVFLDCVAFGSLADRNTGLQKGSKVLISGRLSDDSYEKDGKKVSKVKVICDELSQMASYKKPEHATTMGGKQLEFTEEVYAEDVPF